MLLLSTIESIINKGLIVIFGEEVVGWLFGFIVGYLLDYVCMIEGWYDGVDGWGDDRE